MTEQNKIEKNVTNQTFEYQEKLKKAKKQVSEIKDFYVHLLIYIIVNLGLVIIYFIPGSSDEKDDGFWPIYTILGWGIGLIIHGLSVFVFDGSMFSGWEEKEVQKIMKNEKKN